MGIGTTGAKTIAGLIFGALVVAGLIVSVLILLKIQNRNVVIVEATTQSNATPTTTSMATTSPATAYPYVYNYEGQFTDKKSLWYQLLGVPTSSLFQSLQEQYRNTIQSLLNSMFHQAYAYVSYLSNDAGHIRVFFVLTLLNSSTPHAPSAKSLQIRLEKGAAGGGHEWSPIKIDNDEPQPPIPVSQDQGWKDAAKMFTDAMDTRFDPCQNFYAFTCNKWIKSHPLVHTYAIDHFSVLQDKINSRMQDLLQSSASTGPKTLQSASTFYHSCITSTSRSTNGTARVLSVLDSLGGWPIIDQTGNWTPPSDTVMMINLLTKYDDKFVLPVNENTNEPFDAHEALVNLISRQAGRPISGRDRMTNSATDIARLMGILYNNYSVPSLLEPGVDIDARNVTRNSLYIDQAALSFPASIFVTDPDELVRELSRMIAQVALMLASEAGLDVDMDSVIEDAASVAQFEFLMAKISVSAGDRRNQSALYNPYNIASASEKWPAIDWEAYLTSLTENHGVSSESLGQFVIMEPSYVDELNRLLPIVYSYTGGPRVIYNYLLWRLVSSYAQFAAPEFYKVTASLRQRTHPKKNALALPPEQCTQMVQGLLPWAAGRLYVQAEFTDAERMKADIMVRGILSAFRGQLSGLRWMDDLSKLLSMQKIYYMVKNVAYPNFIMDDALLDEYYEPINELIAGKPDIDFLTLYLALTNLQWVKSVQSLDAPPDRTDFGGSPTIVNAWYAPEMNSINLPAAILNDPFFRSDFPMAVNYGALGAVMGHELTHGFDDEGVQFDQTGALNDWMSSYSKEGFTAMAQCAVQEYSEFCFNINGKHVCVNGNTTQGENIADNGGIKAAYQAYKAYVASNGEEMRLPGMESYTMEQIFFLSFGHVWCSNVAPGYLMQQLMLDPHSPAKVRVIGTLKNFPPFAEAFGCRPGDTMYPKRHCNVW